MVKELALIAAQRQSSVTGLATIRVPRTYDGATCSLLARQIAWSLDNEPQRWKFDSFQLLRDDGADVWVANDADGIGIGHGEGNARPGNFGDDCGKQMVWRAFQRWLPKYVGGSQ